MATTGRTDPTIGVGVEPLAVVPAAPEPALKRRRYTVSEFYKMAEVGILKPEERVELIDGEIFVMCPIGSPHAGVVDRLMILLVRALDPRASIRVQNPIRLSDLSEPEPDLSVLRPRGDSYTSSHPTPDDVHLVIEVMDSSADHDRGKKLGAYARAGIREVWLVDLNGELVEAYRRPVGEEYSEKREHRRGDSVAPEAFPDAVLGVDAILG